MICEIVVVNYKDLNEFIYSTAALINFDRDDLDMTQEWAEDQVNVRVERNGSLRKVNKANKEELKQLILDYMNLLDADPLELRK